MKFIGEIEGKSIIDSLDIKSLESGIHHFYFQASYQNSSIPIFIPVMVAVGKQKGKTLLLNSATHGVELNGVKVIHKVFDALKVDKMKGNVLAIPGMNPIGIFMKSSDFKDGNHGGIFTNLNRVAPGKKAGNPAERYVYAVWEKLLKGNIDCAIDLHSSGNSGEFCFFTFCDTSKGDAPKEMVEAINPDASAFDPGEKGIFETEFVKAGIPAVTLELGTNDWDKTYIDKSYKGVMNYITKIGIFESTIKNKKKEIIWGDSLTLILAEAGGYVEKHVKLLDKVSKGEHLATQYNSFGDKIMEYKAPFNAHVVCLSSDPTADPGSSLIYLLHYK